MLQQIINIIFRYPRSAFKRYKRFGGIISYRAMAAGRRQMQAAAYKLPPVHSVKGGLPVYFLTGKKYIYQTLFCIQSLAKAGVNVLEYHLVDDGSFDERIINQLKQQLPEAILHTSAEIETALEGHLPANQFPVIHQKRKVYPHLKKLSDIHTLSPHGWKLVIDSDMLFWEYPHELISWLEAPDKPVYMQDCETSYGYSASLMQQLCGSEIAGRLNVGVIGLNSASINWQNIEQWIARLEAQEGASYYLEQALTAMLVGNQSCHVLPADTYIVNPGTQSIANNLGVLHHYVDLSKEGYFKTAWKKIR